MAAISPIADANARLGRLVTLNAAACKDLNDEFMMILNHAAVAIAGMKRDDPLVLELVALKLNVCRCVEITTCLSLITIRSGD